MRRVDGDAVSLGKWPPILSTNVDPLARRSREIQSPFGGLLLPSLRACDRKICREVRAPPWFQGRLSRGSWNQSILMQDQLPIREHAHPGPQKLSAVQHSIPQGTAEALCEDLPDETHDAPARRPALPYLQKNSADLVLYVSRKTT